MTSKILLIPFPVRARRPGTKTLSLVVDDLEVVKAEHNRLIHLIVLPKSFLPLSGLSAFPHRQPDLRVLQSGPNLLNAERPWLAELLFLLTGELRMLWTILVILLILWLLGFIGHVGGSLIHLLLVVAVIVLIINLVSGRRS